MPQGTPSGPYRDAPAEARGRERRDRPGQREPATTRRPSRRVPGIAAVVLVGLAQLVPCPAADPPPPVPRVVILGFDGADPGLVARYRREGRLPNLDALAAAGTYSPLTPTNPPQTPVSWASFATGLNPGRTEIFDFLQRRDGSYTPDLALVTPGRRPFLAGARNGLLLGALAGAGSGLLLAAGLGLARVRCRWCLLAGAAAAAVVGLGTGGPLGRLLPEELPDATNNRKGTPFWTIAARSGLRVTVTHMPVTFPAEKLPPGSWMLSGLGVPDMRGRVGTPSFYTSDPGFDPGDNQFSLELLRLPARRGAIETHVVGPFNLPFHDYVLQRERERGRREKLPADERRRREGALVAALARAGVEKRLDLPLRLDVDDAKLCWQLSGQSGCLTPGQWSDWVVLDFPLNWLVDTVQPLRGMVRFKLVALEPEVQLYMMPINFHPSCHPVAYSWPPEWAEKLSDSVGLFKTIGWSTDTWSQPSGVGGIDLFLEDMNATVDASEKILFRTLAEDPPDILAHYFEFPDRAGHMLWHELDPGHPLHDPALAARYEEAMRETYARMDAIIGRVRARLDPRTLILVASDHGFSSFRRQINYNTWLYQHGFLGLKGQTGTRDLQQLFDKDVTGVDVFSGIDWSRTRAWAMGLGSIYLNVAGREAQGIVMPGDDYERTIAAIRDGLEREVDPATGERPVFKVYRREEIYRGFDARKVPDLRPANKLNYRVSWQDTLGGLSTSVFEDNLRYWTGDHCSLEPSLVPGILLVNRRLLTAAPAIEDVAPSILAELGLPPDETLDGRIIW